MSHYFTREGGILRKHTKVMMRQADLPEIEVARFSLEYDAQRFIQLLEQERDNCNKLVDTSTPEKRMNHFVDEVQVLINKLGLDSETGAPDYLLAGHVGESMKIFMTCYKAGLEIALHVDELRRNDPLEDLRQKTKAGIEVPA